MIERDKVHKYVLTLYSKHPIEDPDKVIEAVEAVLPHRTHVAEISEGVEVDAAEVDLDYWFEDD